MKPPTKRIFYRMEVTRVTFDTEMPIRTRLHTLTARRRDCPHTYPRTLPARRSDHPRRRTHYQHVAVPARTYAPAPTHTRRWTRTQKSLAAERYQAFSEAKCLS